MNGIKKRIEKAKGKWIEELPRVLWAYRYTPWKITNELPYSLAFGFETVISLEVGLPTIWTEAYDNDHNTEVLVRDQDLSKERREHTLIQMASLPKHTTKRSNVEKNFAWWSRFEKACCEYQGPVDRKLDSNWEGSYKITKLTGKGTYNLKDQVGKQIPKPWNSNNLRKFYW